MEKEYRLKGRVVLVKRFVDKPVLFGKPKIFWQANFKEHWSNKRIKNPPTGTGSTAKSAFNNFVQVGIPAWEKYNKRGYPF
jgi:hypothetical protein